VQWLLLSGRGERRGLSVGSVLPLGVATLLACQASPDPRKMRGGSRDDGLERQDQPI